MLNSSKMACGGRDVALKMKLTSIIHSGAVYMRKHLQQFEEDRMDNGEDRYDCFYS